MHATMIPLVTLQELFAFNYWARDRQLEACVALSQEQFQRLMAQLPFVTGHSCAPSWRRMGMARTLPRTVTAMVARRR